MISHSHKVLKENGFANVFKKGFITFKVKDKEEFEELKAVSQLPDEEWELIG